MRQVPIVTLGFLSFLATTGVAHAAESSDLLDLARPVLDAAMSGNYVYAAALALVLAVAAARKHGGKVWPFLKSGEGGALLVVLGSFAAALATSIGAGAGVSWLLAWASLKVAIVAAGGYSLFDRLVLPLAKRAAKRVPFLGRILKLVEWIFPDREAKAKAAGDLAVANNPPEGLVGFVGKAKKID